MKSEHAGPYGVILELDTAQCFPDDPGQGTPAIVHYGGGTATYACANGTGYVYSDKDGDIELPGPVRAWLWSAEVEALVEKCWAIGAAEARQGEARTLRHGRAS